MVTQKWNARLPQCMAENDLKKDLYPKIDDYMARMHDNIYYSLSEHINFKKIVSYH